MAVKRAPLEVSFARLAAPWGPIVVVHTGVGLLNVQLRPARHWQAELQQTLGEATRFTRQGSTHASEQIAEYLRGARRRFELRLDWRLVGGFRRDVLRALFRVPFGRLLTYGQLASRVKRPGGARAVGGAMRHNPLPIVVPCHRVVAADGSLGGFSGGLDIKRRLLELEGQDQRPGGWTTATRC